MLRPFIILLSFEIQVSYPQFMFIQTECTVYLWRSQVYLLLTYIHSANSCCPYVESSHSKQQHMPHWHGVVVLTN